MADQENKGDFATGERSTPEGPVRDFAEGEEQAPPGPPRDFAEGEEQAPPGEEDDFAEGQEGLGLLGRGWIGLAGPELDEPEPTRRTQSFSDCTPRRMPSSTTSATWGHTSTARTR